MEIDENIIEEIYDYLDCTEIYTSIEANEDNLAEIIENIEDVFFDNSGEITLHKNMYDEMQEIDNISDFNKWYFKYEKELKNNNQIVIYGIYVTFD